MSDPLIDASRLRQEKVMLVLSVNGEREEIACFPEKTLLEALREDLGLTGTKHGCELGECGACAVLLDGQPILSCLKLALECPGHDILTVEGLAQKNRLHPLQAAFLDLGAAQCGYCTPGILCTAKALLDKNPSPTRAEIAEALSGNLCRCTGYLQIFEAVEEAARRLRDPAAASAAPGDDPPSSLHPEETGERGPRAREVHS